MANENKNTGPQNIDPRNLRQGLKELLEDQGDYNNLLKDSIRYVDSLDKTYTRISARINALNKDTVNTKQLNQELQRLSQKQYIADKNRRDIEAEISEETKAIVENAKQTAKNEKEVLSILQSQGNLEAIALYTAQQAFKISQQQYEIGKAELQVEKELTKQIGFSGAAFKFLSDKLGVGSEFYGEMVTKARQLQAENKKITFFDKLGILGKATLSGIKEVFTDPFAFIAAIPAFGAAITGLVGGLKSALDYVLGIQDKTVKFARAMNMSTTEARRIKMEFASLNVSSGDLFVTSQKMMESQMEFGDALGVTNRLSNEQLATNIKLKDITGLDLETRKGIVEASTITGKSSETLTKSVLAQVVGLKSATGISFQYQKILKEASNLGGYLGLSFAKYPSQLTKSLITVKAMGMELKQLDQIADSFLDFESSISKEFEAQLLTGRDINLAKAREAFLNNDLATAAQEITSQVGSAGEFLKLNRIQAESLASAFGMSRDQMGDMLKQQELLAKLGAKQGDSAREQLRLGLERYKNQKELSAAIGEEAYQSLMNASAQEKIAAFIEKIKQSLADFVEKSGIINKIEGFIAYLSQPENIRAVVIKIRDVFASIVDIVATIATGIVNILDFVGAISDQNAASAKSFLSGAGNSIRSLGGDFGSVSVGGNVAASQVGATNQAGGQANMAMARPGQAQAVNLSVVTKVVDSAADAQTRYSKGGYNEQQTGQ